MLWLPDACKCLNCRSLSRNLFTTLVPWHLETILRCGAHDGSFHVRLGRLYEATRLPTLLRVCVELTSQRRRRSVLLHHAELLVAATLSNEVHSYSELANWTCIMQCELAAAVLRWNATKNTIRCPYCRRRHYHSIFHKPDTGNTNLPSFAGQLRALDSPSVYLAGANTVYIPIRGQHRRTVVGD